MRKAKFWADGWETGSYPETGFEDLGVVDCIVETTGIDGVVVGVIAGRHDRTLVFPNADT